MGDIFYQGCLIKINSSFVISDVHTYIFPLWVEILIHLLYSVIYLLLHYYLGCEWLECMCNIKNYFKVTPVDLEKRDYTFIFYSLYFPNLYILPKFCPL